MGLVEVLTVIFVICKLTGVISWSWWQVFILEMIAGVFYLGIIGVMIYGVFKR